MTDESSVELSRRKVLGGLAGIGVASAGAGAGTWAYFSDEESSENNEIQAGTIELDLTNGDGFEYTYENVAPGDGRDANGYPLEFHCDLAHTGTIEADRTTVYIEHEMDWSGSPTPDADHGMERHLDIEEFVYDGSWYVESYTATSRGAEKFDGLSQGQPATVEDISGDVARLETTPAPGGEESFRYAFEVSEEMGNEFQGAELTTKIYFALLQDEEQGWNPPN